MVWLLINYYPYLKKNLNLKLSIFTHQFGIIEKGWYTFWHSAIFLKLHTTAPLNHFYYVALNHLNWDTGPFYLNNWSDINMEVKNALSTRSKIKRNDSHLKYCTFHKASSTSSYQNIQIWLHWLIRNRNGYRSKTALSKGEKCRGYKVSWTMISPLGGVGKLLECQFQWQREAERAE